MDNFLPKKQTKTTCEKKSKSINGNLLKDQYINLDFSFFKITLSRKVYVMKGKTKLLIALIKN
jgi:hypothetical protein